MAVGNGKDTGVTTLLEAIEEHGGVWFNNAAGTAVIQHQLAQTRASQGARMQLAQFEAQRQVAIAALQAECDRAQADFIAAMKSSDYESVAKAVRRMTRAETALVNLGVYDK